MTNVDSSAPGASENATGAGVESPGACDECTRLDEQETAAILSGDESRAADLRVMRRRHNTQAHNPYEKHPVAMSRPPVGFSAYAGSAFMWTGRIN
jgi:hypothetical protein